MKLSLRKIAWLFPLLLTGCFHRHPAQVRPVAPAVVEKSAPQPVPAPQDTVVPQPVAPAQPAASPQNTAQTPAQTVETPKPPVHHKRPVNHNTQQASNGAASGVSAIGQLSAGSSNDQARQAADSLGWTERALNGINRKLSDPEAKTAARIREYIKQGRAALATGDADGAHTLAVKARILLGELTK